MLLPVKDGVQVLCTNAPNAATAATLSGTAIAGYITPATAGYTNGQLIPYTLFTFSQWEVGIGTYSTTGPTVTRSKILSNHLGTTAAIDFSAGANPTFMVTQSGKITEFFQTIMQGVTPGGRLTLSSGNPIQTADVTSSTNIYYSPYVSNIITLWDGYLWSPIEFTEYTLALGTLTASLGYDVFAYNNNGALALEILAWTNAITRATAITIQDGRYCKSSDKTRLYLGSFYTASTTTTADSALNRFLFNHYNKVDTTGIMTNSTSHAYSTGAWREWNGGSSRINIFVGLTTPVNVTGSFTGNTTNTVYPVSISVNSVNPGSCQMSMFSSSSYVACCISSAFKLSVGFSYIVAAEYGSSGTSTYAIIGALYQC